MHRYCVALAQVLVRLHSRGKGWDMEIMKNGRAIRRLTKARLSVLALAVFALLAAGSATGVARADFVSSGGMMFGGLQLSEIRVDQSGADTDEYFELYGQANMGLDGWWFLAVGDSGTDTGGVIEMAVNLSQFSLGSNGYFVAHEATFGTGIFNGQSLMIDPSATHATIGTGDSLNFENSDNVTYMLVHGFVGSVGADLDNNNDGVLDVLLWTDLADSVAFMSTSSLDQVYSAQRVGPVTTTGTGGMPAHAFWNSGAWEIGAYNTWDMDTPGKGPPVPAPGALGLGMIAGLVGRGYHRPARRG